MAEPFKIEISKTDLANIQIALAGIKNGASSVLSRAINKTLDGVRTDAVDEIANIITPTKTVIRDTFTVKKTSAANLEGSTSSKGKPLGLIHYQARQTLKGVSVKIYRSDTRKLILGAFIATVKGTQNVWWRVWHGPKQKVRINFKYGVLKGTKYSVPIERLTGPRVPDIMAKPETMQKILALAQARLDNNLSNQLDYELSKL